MSDSLSIHARAGASPAGKDEVLDLIAETATKSSELEKFKPAKIKKELASREKVVTTAIGHGVAIPHCFLDNIDRFVVGLVTTTEGIDFGAPDGERVRLFFFIIGPSNRRNQHVRLLSEISTAVRTPETRERFLAVSDSENIEQQLRKLLVADDESEETQRCLFHVFVQSDELFDPILEELSAHVNGNIAVQELKSAGSYLNRMPLFAAMWSERKDDQSVRLLLAVVDKRLLNETARRIHHIAGMQGNQEGVLIVAHDLVYSAGALSF